MQLARTILSDSATFIEKKRIENLLWPKSEFLWPKNIYHADHFNFLSTAGPDRLRLPGGLEATRISSGLSCVAIIAGP